MTDIDVYAVVLKLIGPIEPIGCHSTDMDRKHNLERMTSLVDLLMQDIVYVSRDKGRHEDSVKQLGVMSYKFIKDMKESIAEELDESDR
jgi:hypothetical protein